MMRSRVGKVRIVCLAMVCIFAVAAGNCLAAGSNYTFDKSGNLMMPENYRTWVYVGTPVTPNDMNPPQAAFPDFHNVYIHPDAYNHYAKTGNFMDGTILVVTTGLLPNQNQGGFSRHI
jgi:hypothetical protein